VVEVAACPGVAGFEAGLEPVVVGGETKKPAGTAEPTPHLGCGFIIGASQLLMMMLLKENRWWADTVPFSNSSKGSWLAGGGGGELTAAALAEEPSRTSMPTLRL
jgi:hypothetical protein